MAFNPGIHEHLLAQGYEYHHNPADWQDVGDCENGPELSGGPAWDCYSNGKDYLAVDEEGEVHGPYQENPDPEDEPQ